MSFPHDPGLSLQSDLSLLKIVQSIKRHFHLAFLIFIKNQKVLNYFLKFVRVRNFVRF